MEYKEIDLEVVEEYVLSQSSGSINTVRDYILRLSTAYDQRGCVRMPEDDAWNMAKSFLNSLADEGKIRGNWRVYPHTKHYGLECVG